MSFANTTPLIAAALLIASPAVALASESDQRGTTAASDTELAADTLAEGYEQRAIDSLGAALKENPDDPALMINLGIAYARIGSDLEAQSLFEAALSSRNTVDLETADGRITDSRRVARRALSMLRRGEFYADAPQDARASRLSLRR